MRMPPKLAAFLRLKMGKLLTFDKAINNTDNPYRPLKNGETASLLTIDEVEKTADFTAVANYSYSVNSVTGAVKVKLPSAAENGATITLQDTGGVAAVNNITIRNAADTSTWGVLDVNSGVITFVYNIIAGKWFVNYKTAVNTAAQHLKYSRTTAQTGISAGTQLLFDTLESSMGSNISINTGTGTITLQPGFTYRLRAGVSYVLSNGTACDFQYIWRNVTSSTNIGNKSWDLSVGFPSNDGAYMGTAEAIITPTVATQVSVICISQTNVNSINAATSPAWCEVEAISSNTPINPNVYVTKSSGVVNAGVEVVLGNLRARIPTSGNRSLQVATVSGTYSVYGSCTFVNAGNTGGSIIAAASPRSVTTTFTYLNSGLNFTNGGDISIWVIMDAANNISWRLQFIIGADFNNNMISIEQLV